MSHVAEWAEYFALTTLIELAVAVPLLGENERLWRRLALVTFAQLTSHPIVWFVLPALGWQRGTYLLVAETWAVVSELVLYRVAFERLAWSRALGVSAVANGASLALCTWLG